MSNEAEIEQLKTKLRARLIPAIGSMELADWILDYLNSLGKRSPPRQELARALGAHFARYPSFLRHKNFVERLISDRPLELEAVLRQSDFDQMQNFMQYLREFQLLAGTLEGHGTVDFRLASTALGQLILITAFIRSRLPK
jgi:hypothetical protein